MCQCYYARYYNLKWIVAVSKGKKIRRPKYQRFISERIPIGQCWLQMGARWYVTEMHTSIEISLERSEFGEGCQKSSKSKLRRPQQSRIYVHRFTRIVRHHCSVHDTVFTPWVDMGHRQCRTSRKEHEKKRGKKHVQKKYGNQLGTGQMSRILGSKLGHRTCRTGQGNNPIYCSPSLSSFSSTWHQCRGTLQVFSKQYSSLYRLPCMVRRFSHVWRSRLAQAPSPGFVLCVPFSHFSPVQSKRRNLYDFWETVAWFVICLAPFTYLMSLAGTNVIFDISYHLPFHVFWNSTPPKSKIIVLSGKLHWFVLG